MPSAAILRVPEMLYLAIGILGATVMPHNLYLHSSIVQTRRIGREPAAKREAMEELLRTLQFDWSVASYMGDDVIDLPVLTRCGLAATVPEAPVLVRRHSHFVSENRSMDIGFEKILNQLLLGLY